MNMTKNILLLGVMEALLDDVQHQLERADLQFFGGTSLEDVRAVFARADIDHVIVGAEIDLETRLQIVREIFQFSERTSVHMKDYASGSQGFLPFVRSVLRGVIDDEFSSASACRRS
jgi:hypothetical protein